MNKKYKIDLTIYNNNSIHLLADLPQNTTARPPITASTNNSNY